MGTIQKDKDRKSNMINGDDGNQNGDKNREFLESVKEQLYMETFQADVPDYSYEKVEALVKIIEVAEGVDDNEIEKNRREFMENFQKIAAEEKKKNRNNCWRKFARGTAAMAAILLAADITSQAVMDKSLFHMIESWTNQLIVMPGETQPEELADFQENETIIFDNVEEFAEYFGEEFFVCGWLPEGVELRKIDLSKTEYSSTYVWEYGNEDNTNSITIQMCEKVSNDIAGLTGTQFEASENISFSNGVKSVVYINNDACLAGFEHNDWWYIVTSFGNEDIMESILGGMVVYE